MTSAAARARFQDIAATGAAPAEVRALAAKLHNPAPSVEDRLHLAAVFTHAAFAAPDRVAELYDAAAEGWLGEAINGPQVTPLGEPPVAINPDFWNAFWQVVD